MMGLKLCGILLVWIGCLGIGSSCQAHLKKRIRSLTTVRRQILLLQGEIGYTGATLPEAIERIAVRERGKPYSGERTVDFFELLHQQLQCEADGCFQDKWNRAIELAAEGMAFAGEDIRELSCLGEYLGWQDRETQVRQMEWYLNQSEETLAQIRKGEKEKLRLYRTLSVLGGAFLCIILL